MPTFSFSDDEIRSLIPFFEAFSHQPEPFIPQKIEPLTPAETNMARELFTSPAAPCLKCHATGDPKHDENAFGAELPACQGALAARRGRTAGLPIPQQIIPGTAMPSGLFRRDRDRWVFSGPVPAASRATMGIMRISGSLYASTHARGAALLVGQNTAATAIEEPVVSDALGKL